MPKKTELIEVKTLDGKSVWVQAELEDTSRQIGLEASRSQEVFATVEEKFEESLGLIKSVSRAITHNLAEMKPDEADVSFGLKFSVKAGKLIGCLVDASGDASISVTLKWKFDKSANS